MNEINTSADFRPGQAKPAAQGARPAAARPEPQDLRALIAALTQGEDALARRRDLGELHKRLVAMMATLNTGLGEAQAARVREDRAELVARLDQIERAVNSMDGALRIELEPMLRGLVQEAVGNATARPSGGLFRDMRLWIIIAGAIAVGAVFSNGIRGAAMVAMTGMGLSAPESFLKPSPEGGIADGANLMK
ncbi:hypothetical protein RNZ50_00225 [Paracoccaceae bacterium Fryx2]|nr:hypothetical protein [Paracoccaceae bacterium Fryx2]